jgi:hypothetical protein
MCVGAGPSQPKTQKVGPSKKDLRQQKQENRELRADMRDTQKEFRQQLQDQIDAANAAAAEAAAQASAIEIANTQPTYSVTTTEGDTPTTVTQPIQAQTPTRRTTGALTIGNRRAPATGLNIGR